MPDKDSADLEKNPPDQYPRKDGDVETGGCDFIGRDQIIRGDSVQGDKVEGDRITIENIGEGTAIAAGREAAATILNIDVRWLPVVLILIGVSATLAFFLFQTLKGPGAMSGTFNIAVAAFDEVQNGTSLPSEAGERVAAWLSEALILEKQSYPPGTIVEIWGPDQIGRISGDQRAARAADAEAMAEEINANVVIYGSITREENASTISPEFFVRSEGFLEAQEITGQHQLGQPIFSPGDIFSNPVLSADLNRELNGRTIALSHFTIGLSYFALGDYFSAFEAFSDAETVPDWEADQGKEVVYLFIGNAALKAKDFETAHHWFDKAIESNPAYARAFIGEAETYYQEAIRSLNDAVSPHVDLDFLSLAIESFNAGLAARDQPAFADVEAKAHFGLGRSFLLKSWQGDDNLWMDAETELRKVTEAYEADNVRLMELAAQAYGHLGLLNFILGDDKEAILAYEAALSIEQLNQFKAQYASQLNILYADKGDAEAASKYAALAEEFSQSIQPNGPE